KKVPSHYFREHWLATFIVDRNGISVRHQVGIENMAWSTDFPHHGNDWPYSQRTIDSLFAEVPAEERRKILCTNAARFWGLMAQGWARRGRTACLSETKARCSKRLPGNACRSC